MFIYKITNKLNDKIYVGQTKTTISKRWSGHKCDCKRKNTPLYALMRKHIDSIDSIFSISVLEEVDSYEELDSREIYWIQELNSMHPNGFNMSEGGQSFLTKEEISRMSARITGSKNPMYGMFGELNPFYGKTHTEETKSVLRAKKIGSTHSEESKDKISKAVKYRHDKFGHPFEGRHHTKETRDAISEKLKDRVFTDEHKQKIRDNHARKRGTIMLDKNNNANLMEFDSMADAARWIASNTRYKKAKSSVISEVCSGNAKTAYGYKWSYL